MYIEREIIYSLEIEAEYEKQGTDQRKIEIFLQRYFWTSHSEHSSGKLPEGCSFSMTLRFSNGLLTEWGVKLANGSAS